MTFHHVSPMCRTFCLIVRLLSLILRFHVSAHCYFWTCLIPKDMFLVSILHPWKGFRILHQFLLFRNTWDRYICLWNEIFCCRLELWYSCSPRKECRELYGSTRWTVQFQSGVLACKMFSTILMDPKSVCLGIRGWQGCRCQRCGGRWPGPMRLAVGYVSALHRWCIDRCSISQVRGSCEQFHQLFESSFLWRWSNYIHFKLRVVFCRQLEVVKRYASQDGFLKLPGAMGNGSSFLISGFGNILWNEFLQGMLW